MPEMKGITVKIPADLHAEVKAYLEAHGMTMGEFIVQAVDHEPVSYTHLDVYKRQKSVYAYGTL